MGSWANSLHVKHTDATVVANAIRGILQAEGQRLDPRPHRPAAAGILSALLAGHGLPEEEEDFGDPDARGVCVYQPVAGWVGVLDSGDVHRLSVALSERLQTETLVVMVNDSDSWFYELRRNGRALDAFDSHGATEDDGALTPEMQAALASGDDDEFTRLMMARIRANAPKGPIVLHDGSTMLPPDIALLRAEIDAGRASFWDRLRYRWLWVRLLFRLATGWLRPGGLRFGFDIERATPLDEETLRGHITHLRTLFPKASEKALRKLLKQNRFPAEELLAEFLTVLGLPAFYAYLNHDYLEDYTDAQLTAKGIRLAAEMRFQPVEE